MKITLKIWRQKNAEKPGRLVTYERDGVSADMSFLEMLDVLNEDLTAQGEEPVAFDHDCREGICGSCGVVIDGVAHGPQRTTTCQLHMRSFADGDTITVEPWPTPRSGSRSREREGDESRASRPIPRARSPCID